jgi:hypothetical protein
LRAQVLVEEAVKREALYAELVIEASKRFVEAWRHQARGPEVVAGLYPAIERMRLTSSGEVIRVAEPVVRLVIQDYPLRENVRRVRQRVGSEDWDDPPEGIQRGVQGGAVRALRG